MEDVGRRILVALSCCFAALLLAACGGGGHKQAAPPVGSQPSHGGTVSAAPTIGRVGPAEIVQPGSVRQIGKPAPILPKAAHLTPSQLHGVAGGVACASASLSPSARNLGSVGRSIICLLNAQRASHGMAPLRLNVRLTRASRGMAALMVRQRFFAHNTPSGRTLLDRVRATGYVNGRWQLGENLAWGSGGLATPAAIVNGWMNSPGHRANILHAAFRDIGIGIRLGPPLSSVTGGATYVTDFGRHG